MGCQYAEGVGNQRDVRSLGVGSVGSQNGGLGPVACQMTWTETSGKSQHRVGKSGTSFNKGVGTSAMSVRTVWDHLDVKTQEVGPVECLNT